MIDATFFIKHPRFVGVIAIVMVLLGLLAICVLPVAQYPQMTPPQIVVQATYPGASAQILMDTVAVPIENEINGVEDMLYMSSSCNDNGIYKLTITFNIGTDGDMAQVKVQNRLSQIQSVLPDVVQKEGVSVKLQASNMLGLLALTADNPKITDLSLSNYAYTYIQNPIKRVPGISQADIYGPQNSVRIWINPKKLSSLQLSSTDVIQAIESQNINLSVGSIGAAPSPPTNRQVINLMAKGLLSSVDDFQHIILKTDKAGGITYLKDVATIEMGEDSYNLHSYLNDNPAVIMMLSQTPNSNALNIMKNVRQTINDLSKTLPDGFHLEVVYDSTDFVRASIESIIFTLMLTFGLVVFVVFIFLQSFKATLIPMLTIPVSLIATFAVLYVAGFNINILTLFAMILAIGLVVDDAIIVVERVQYLIKFDKMQPEAASIQAMKDIGGAIIGTTLVLLSIFVPVSLMAGITGKIYSQFALTIATAILFSAVNALTLSPALCALFLKQNQEEWLFFTYFNRFLEKGKEIYLKIVAYFCQRLTLSALISVAVIGGICFLFLTIPTSFIPPEDQGVLFADVQLPQTASQNRTKEVLMDLGTHLMKEPGVAYVVSINGASLLGSEGENIGMNVIGLSPWKQRDKAGLAAPVLMHKIRQKFTHNPVADINFFELPAIPGVGNAGGLSFQLNAINQDTSFEQLNHQLNSFLRQINKNSDFQFAFSTFTESSPHLFLDMNRKKMESFNVPVSYLFNVLQASLGSQYVNDITLAGQTNKVIVQADFNHRKSVADIENLFVPNRNGKLIQVKNFMRVKEILQPKIISRFNQYLSADITAQTKENVSTGTAIKTIENMARRLGKSYGISWTGLSLQETKAAGLGIILISLAVIFGYLFLVALYESWLVSLCVIFSNIFAVLGALTGLWMIGLPLSIYAQLGLILLVGLASKNAILIVEFILIHKKDNLPADKAALAGAGERFRAVLMTALTFILGVFPMVVATGAGAASQRAIGTSVFFGMLAATLIGIIFVPVLFLICDKGAEKYALKRFPKKKRNKK